MRHTLKITSLKRDIRHRFGKKAKAICFGITEINLRKTRGENISFVLQHYSTTDFSYEIFFESFISFQVRDNMLTQEEDIGSVKFNEQYDGIIIHQIVDGIYLNLLKTDSTLELDNNIGGLGNKEILQFSIYEQNLVVDILTQFPPSIILIDSR